MGTLAVGVKEKPKENYCFSLLCAFLFQCSLSETSDGASWGKSAKCRKVPGLCILKPVSQPHPSGNHETRQTNVHVRSTSIAVLQAQNQLEIDGALAAQFQSSAKGHGILHKLGLQAISATTLKPRSTPLKSTSRTVTK